MYYIEPRAFKIKHEHKLPINYKTEWKHLFQPDYEYLNIKLGVKEIKNAFVNHYGLVIKNGLLVKGCAPNIGFSNYDDRFYYQHWRKAVEQMLVCRFGKSLPSVKLDDNRKYLLIHSPWFSYYFWITECIPRILMVKNHLKDLTLIYPESWDKFRFVKDTLSLFPELSIQKVETDKHLWVKNLIMPEVKPWTPMFIPEQVLEVRSFLLKSIQQKNFAELSSTNIYMSRRDSKRKNFENETDVSAMLKENGFIDIAFGDISMFEQINIIHKAQNVVSITGAGMSNFTFLSPGASVLDFTNEKYLSHKKYKFHYWKLSNIVEADYYVQFCPHTNHNHIPRFSLQNLIAPIPEMEKNVKQMLAKG